MGSIDSLYSLIAGSDSYVFDKEYKDAAANTKKYYDENEKLKEEIRELNEELDKETLVDPSIGRTLSRALGLYTERGEEINKKVQGLREKQREAEDKWHNAAETIQRKDAAAREKQMKAYQQPAISPATQKSYKGFEMDTHTPYLQEKLSKGDAYIAEMSPRQYLEQVAYNIFGKSSLESTVRGTVPKNVKKYARMMKQGTNFYMPSLNYDSKQQEGRHRALAALINGYDKIPVLVVPKKR